MEEVNTNVLNTASISNETNGIIKIGDELLNTVRQDIESNKTISIPIDQLATLGAGVSSLIPSLHNVTQTTTINTENLYKLANQSVGDTLKIAKNGNFWGAFKTVEGKSKFAQLQAAGPLTATSTTVMPIDPATMMMAVALFSVEQKLGQIQDMQKQILGFLEREKKAEIEADVVTLMNMVNKYKLNWDNEHFIASNHKMVIDIQRTALKNINTYQTEVSELVDYNRFVTVKTQVTKKFNKLQDKFNYYRLTLYTYSLATLLEIMLGGNFKEENILEEKNKILNLVSSYRDSFNKASLCIEKMSNSLVESNLLKGVGVAAKSVGDFIGSIPIIKEGQVDEFLQDVGKNIKSNAKDSEYKCVQEFAMLNNPGVSSIIQQMDTMVRIYNHTSQIYFDDKKIYLLA